MPGTAFGYAGGTVIWIGAGTVPTDEEWAPYTRLWSEVSSKGGLLRCLVLADTAGPNAAQRQEVIKAVNGGNARTAVVSSSRTARGIVRVLGWFDTSIRCFAPEDVRAALAFLEVSPAEQDAIWDTVESLTATLKPQSVDAVTVALRQLRR